MSRSRVRVPWKAPKYKDVVLKKITFVVACTIAFQSCPGIKPRQEKTQYPDKPYFSDSTAHYLYHPIYANNFYIIRQDGEKILYLRNPVTGQETKQIIKKVKRVVCLSSTHVAYLDAINETSSITGVSGLPYIYNKKKLKATDVGYESAIDYEKVLQLNPDVVFAYSIQGQTAEYLDKIRQLGLTVVEMTEHLENHPLEKPSLSLPLRLSSTKRKWRQKYLPASTGLTRTSAHWHNKPSPPRPLKKARPRATKF